MRIYGDGACRRGIMYANVWYMYDSADVSYAICK